MEVLPKGTGSPLKLFEVGGIAEGYNLMLSNKDHELAKLA
jgi:hypothetical protein